MESVEIDEIRSTPDHPFYVPKKGFTNAAELRAGDILLSINGDYVIIEKIQHEILEAPISVYNFRVANDHTYYVGSKSVGVHNAGAGYDPQPEPVELSRTQAKNIEKLDNLINDHLKDTDFSGTLRDLQGDPVPNGEGGYWNHLQEMLDTYKGLYRVYEALGRNLKNPNLSESARTTLESAYQTAEDYIFKIWELFEPYGGIEAYE